MTVTRSAKKIMTISIIIIFTLILFVVIIRNISTHLDARFIDKSLNTSTLIQKNALLHSGSYTYDNGDFYTLYVAMSNVELVRELRTKITFTPSDVNQARSLYAMSPYSHQGNDIPHETRWLYAEGINTQGTNRYKISIGEDTGSVIILVTYPDYSDNN